MASERVPATNATTATNNVDAITVANDTDLLWVGFILDSISVCNFFLLKPIG